MSTIQRLTLLLLFAAVVGTFGVLGLMIASTSQQLPIPNPQPLAASPQSLTTSPQPPTANHQPPTISPHPSLSTLHSLSTPTPTSTDTPTPTLSLALTPGPTPPPSAQITDIVGHHQSLPLSCESRSAADWAGYFGVHIDELTFLHGLPPSDNPERGFVGSVTGAWGQIPPNPYGVHAGPVATLLRAYGLKARGYHDLTWDDLRAEIAAGQPVIVWVVGHVETGTGLTYTTSNGLQVIVAPYEHTVILIGYTEESVTILDGAGVYSRPLSIFLKSWSALGNMGIILESR